MNQTQRQFLLNSIEARFRSEKEELIRRKPKAPSLNNFLIASILDGTFQMKDLGAVRDAIRERVLKLGKSEALLNEGADTWGRRSQQDEDEIGNRFINLPVGILFELPPRYAKEKEKYDSEIQEWEECKRALESSFEAMKIKVQLGSDKALQPLIDQADALCSMSLTASSKLFITDKK